MVEELKQPRKHLTAEKVEAIKDALKHFKMIRVKKLLDLLYLGNFLYFVPKLYIFVPEYDIMYKMMEVFSYEKTKYIKFDKISC